MTYRLMWSDRLVEPIYSDDTAAIASGRPNVTPWDVYFTMSLYNERDIEGQVLDLRR